MRQIRSWSSARRLFRLPAWAMVLAAAFAAGAVVGPIAASARPVISSSPGARAAQAQGQSPRLTHVFVIMMENTQYKALLAPSNPNTKFIQQLAATKGLATRYFGVTHVSLPNYIAATSGSNWGSNSDDTAQAPLFNHENLVDQFEAAHVSWKAYMENLPFPGDLTDQTPDGLYVRKHDPFLMYPDVYQNPARADNVVPLTQLSTDLAAGNVPGSPGSPRTPATTCTAARPPARSPPRRPHPPRPSCSRTATPSCASGWD
jgi:phospholipase C